MALVWDTQTGWLAKASTVGVRHAINATNAGADVQQTFREALNGNAAV